MSSHCNRRDVLKGLLAASTAVLVPSRRRLAARENVRASTPVQIQITPVSSHTCRLTILPKKNGSAASIPFDGSLVQQSFGNPITIVQSDTRHSITVGGMQLEVAFDPVRITASNERGDVIQRFVWDSETCMLRFLIGNFPLFGLGEGGPQFDRRGSIDPMQSGQGRYMLATHGGRVPIPWIIGTSGWAVSGCYSCIWHQVRAC